jgi:DNA-binding transcriptional ArsR family regulator
MESKILNVEPEGKMDYEEAVTEKSMGNNLHNPQLEYKKQDPEASRLFWYLFAGSRGGSTRVKIITLLREKPCSRSELAVALGLDYKAVQYQLNVLEKNNLIVRQGERYGVMFFISPYLEAKIGAYDQVCSKISSTSGK